MGGMEGVSFLGVLAGTVAGAVVADVEVRHPEWNVSYFCLGAFAVLGLAASYTVRAREEVNRALHAIESRAPRHQPDPLHPPSLPHGWAL